MNDAFRIVDDLRDGLMAAEAQKATARRLANDPELRKLVIDDWHLQRRLTCLLAEGDTSALWQRIADDLWSDRSSNEAQRTLFAVQRRISARRHLKHNLKHSRQRRMSGWPIPAAILTSAAALIAIVLMMRDDAAVPTKTPTLQVSSIQGEVHVRRADAQLIPQSGMALMAEDRIETQTGSVVVLAMDDGSQLKLSATSVLNWEGKAHFHLGHGTVDVTAQHRDVSDAMTIATTRTTTTVVGTQFTVSYHEGATSLRVSEGVVEFAADGDATRLVHAGEEALDKPNTKTTPPTPPISMAEQTPQVIGFRFVDAASGDTLPGWELVKADAHVDLAKMPQRGWTVEAITLPRILAELPRSNKTDVSTPALQFRINGTVAGKPHSTWPYNLNYKDQDEQPDFKYRPWNPEPGTYQLGAIIIRSKDNPTPFGTPLNVTITVTSTP